MAWTKAHTKEIFKKCHKLLDDWYQAFEPKKLLIAVGTHSREFDRETEQFKNEQWFKDEWETDENGVYIGGRIIDRLISKCISYMAYDARKTRAMETILKNVYGYDTEKETEKIDTGEVHVTRTILTREVTND